MEFVSPAEFLEKLTELGLQLKGDDTFHLSEQGDITFKSEDEIEFTFSDNSTLYFTGASVFMSVVSHTESSLKLKLFA